MSIWIHKNTKVIVQGITGKAGSFHAKACKDYGTQVVGGVTPGKGGETFEGIPVFNTVRDAVDATKATATMIFVPAPYAADAILEAERRANLWEDKSNGLLAEIIYESQGIV